MFTIIIVKKSNQPEWRNIAAGTEGKSIEPSKGASSSNHPIWRCKWWAGRPDSTRTTSTTSATCAYGAAPFREEEGTRWSGRNPTWPDHRSWGLSVWRYWTGHELNLAQTSALSQSSRSRWRAAEKTSPRQRGTSCEDLREREWGTQWVVWVKFSRQKVSFMFKWPSDIFCRAHVTSAKKVPFPWESIRLQKLAFIGRAVQFNVRR